MKNICLLLLIVFCFAACGGGGSDSGNNDSQTIELALDQPVTGKIDELRQVDWYHIHAMNSDRVLSVNLTGTHPNSPVDFMLTIYEKDADGNLVTIFGESAKEEVLDPANISIDVPIDGSRHLYIAVRDFKDDEFSDQVSYRLSATYSDETADNDTFEDAINLEVGTDQICYTEETIFPQSDVDCYRFVIGGATPAGVYRITAQYVLTGNTSVDVNLGLRLYGEDGELVQEFKGNKPADNLYVLLPYLDEGTYFLTVADQGRNHESENGYTLCIAPVDAEEVKLNDTADSDGVDIDGLMVAGADGTSCSLTGTLEYIQDEDWFGFDVTPTASVSKNIIINFFQNFDNGQVPDALQAQGQPAKYRISVRNENLEEVYAFDHSVLDTEPNIVEIGAGAGDRNYLMVKPIYNDQMLMAMPYQVALTLKDVTDANESEDPIVLVPGEPATGKISKLGDKDNFTMDVATPSGPRVVEVFFHTTQPSEVSYAAIVQWDGKTRMLRDTSGTEEGTEFKSSFYIPAATTVNVEVSDDQNNDGSDVEYTLLVNLLDIPVGLPALGDAGGVVTAPVYLREPEERADSSATTVTVIEYDQNIQPEFQANTTLLNVNTLADGQSWTSDWIAGFVDYDNDRDMVELNLDNAIPAIVEGQDPPSYYFDISVQMYAPASEVEYSWTLFRDAPPPNNVLVERMYLENTDEGGFEHFPEGGGIVASWADIEITEETHNVTLPSAQRPEFDTPFWIGDGWRGSKFYFSVNDFDRAVISRELDSSGENYIPVPNQIPDNDWGNTNSTPPVRPYYFQVTVTYHAGCSGPEDEACAP